MRLTALIAASLVASLMLAFPTVAQTPTHPLIGRIVDTRSGVLSELTDPAIIAALFPCGAITLLGEVHDNPDHHKMRAGLIKAAMANRDYQLPLCGISFVFEHINEDQHRSLDQFFQKARTADDPETLFRVLDWENSGWPDKKLFLPLMTEVLRTPHQLVAGSPAPGLVRRIAKDGSAAIRDNPLIPKVDQPLDAPLQEALLTELEASHCGLMPKSAFGNMALAQRYRDAYLAWSAAFGVMKATEGPKSGGSAIIFAGNGHVRTDRGVPRYLRQPYFGPPDFNVISVTFTEVEDGRLDPAFYGPRDPAGKPATDYVAFAAPAPREDPCEAMRARMKK
jgi:uncharacterized iron-regulated protein